MAGESGRVVDTVAAVDVHRHRKPVGGGGLPDRLEHRLAVRLPGLHRDADLHQLGVSGKTFDLGDRAFRVFRVDPDGAAEAVGGVRFEPAIQQPVVDGGADPAVKQIVGNVAAGQRVQNRVVDTGIVEKVPGNGLAVGAGIVLAVQVLAVVSAGCLIPLLLDVGDGPQFVGGGQVAPDFGVIAEVRLNIRVDDHAVRNTFPSSTSTS